MRHQTADEPDVAGESEPEPEAEAKPADAKALAKAAAQAAKAKEKHDKDAEKAEAKARADAEKEADAKLTTDGAEQGTGDVEARPPQPWIGPPYRAGCAPAPATGCASGAAGCGQYV